MMNIARDAQKMEYAKKWIAVHLDDRKFRESIQQRSAFRYRDERAATFGSLDWQRIGFAQDLASLQFNMGITKSGKWDSAQVHSASLYNGRSFILIKLSSAKDFGLGWPPEYFAQIKPAGNDVYVYCDEKIGP